MAQAGLSVSTPPARARAGGSFLHVVSPAELDERDRQEAATRQAAQGRGAEPQQDLASFVRQQWMIFRNHRNLGANALNQRLLRCQRAFEGKYDSDKLAEIAKFGGSEVYSRLVAGKCRGATSLLRDVYLGPDRPWSIESQPDPPVPPDVRANIIQLIGTEIATLQQMGQPIEETQVHMRYVSLLHAAQQAARRNADIQAKATADKIDDILIQGMFYQAFGEFLLDLPLFPYAVLKGPVVRMVPRLTWVQGKAMLQNRPTMFWERVNPFQIYWSPGASNIVDAAIIERKRYTRSDLNDLIGLPGYNEQAVRAALNDYANGLREWLDAPDPEQAINEGREDPSLNRSQYIEGIEYHGNIQGEMLLQEGVDKKFIPDPDRDYNVTTWVVGRQTLKTQINPSPRQRHPYYLTSFEKIPGTIAGHGLPDILEDIQETVNAANRALVNNLGMASGPQVVINDEMISPTEHSDDMYPWKRWHVVGDPLGNQREPITFFQPQSNSQELLLVINAMNTQADEQSAIPRYLTGESLSGGAGRTSSGLAMLMNNAQKVLQTVAANVDTDILEPCLHGMYDMIMLTDTSGILTGEEDVKVQGSEAAIQQETQRQRQLQFLQITANPIDAPIIGMVGRARLLRAVSSDLGLPDDIVPDDQTLQSQMAAQQQLQAAGQALVASAQGQGGGPPGQQGGPGPQGGPGQGSGGAGPAQQQQRPVKTPTGPNQGASGSGIPATGGQAPPVNLMQGGLPNG